MELRQKEVYKVESVYKPFYTGGDLEWTEGGDKLFCQCGSSIQILEVELGKVCASIGQEENEEEKDLITTFTLSWNNENVISAHKSGLFKLWEWKEGKLLKHWKSIHKGPVAKLALSQDGSLMASGGSDSSIRLWKLKHHSCTHNLTETKGVVSVLKFYEKDDVKLVFGAGDDTLITGWNVETGEVVMQLEGHYSKVTGLDFDLNQQFIISCSRDKVLILWDIVKKKQLKILPLYETVEGLAVLPEHMTIPNQDIKLQGGIYVAIAGEKGIIRFWDVGKGSELYVQTNSLINKSSEEGSLSITRILFNRKSASIIVASVDHNIIIHDLYTLSCKRQLVGFSDEILDMVFVGPKQSHLAVATNSKDVKLYSLDNMDCQLLRGHLDLVVALGNTPANLCLFASASKDNSIRVWLLKNNSATCVAKGLRHNNSVGDVALSQTTTSFIVSVSNDTTMKIWNLPKKYDEDSIETLNVKATKIGHEKDINSVTVSPNDKIIATGSLDKTAKLWSSDDLTLLGVLRGHKRSVWSCCFSPVDQVLLTTSADATLKLWSLSDLTCLKSLEGHDSSVLRGYFLSRGTQLLSAGGDGLIKLWSLKSSECTASFDSHDAKVWALAVSADESTLVSGGCDSRIVVWRDATEETRLERIEAEQEKALLEQELANLLQAEDLMNALKLALKLDRPATVLRIVEDVLKKGKEGLSEAVSKLEEQEKQSLVKCVMHWNSNSRHCYPAQVLISILVEEISAGTLKISPNVLETLIPYTERHFKRLTQLLQDLHFIEYVKAIIQPVSKKMDIE